MNYVLHNIVFELFEWKQFIYVCVNIKFQLVWIIDIGTHIKKNETSLEN